ncbi:MAG: hypothetical protein JWN56_796 [Sphingobacteriales bacterium]|nr:hypothetical protein [Sphingobacteriales bacterium]
MKILMKNPVMLLKSIAKSAVYLLVFCLIPALSKAQTEQTTDGKKFQLGFTASPTFGWMSTSSSETIKSDGLRTGFTYGVLGDFSFTNNYYFSSGLVVTTVNSNVKSIATPVQPNTVFKIQYLEVPLTLKLKSNEIQNRKFYGQFGLDANVKLGAKQAIEGQSDADISKNVNLFRLGLIIGGGAEWNVAENISLLTGLSYNNGFTDVFDGSEKAKNSYVSLNLGVFF